MWSCFSVIHAAPEDWEQFDFCISNTLTQLFFPCYPYPICFLFPLLKWLVYSLKQKPEDKKKKF